MARVVVARTQPAQPWRYLAVRVLSGEVLAWKLDLSNVEFTRSLDTPSLRGDIDPAIATDLLLGRADDGLPVLDRWSTAIFAEADGVIRGGGLLVRPTRQGSTLTLECTGYKGWLARQLYLGNKLSYIQADPLDVVRDLVAWAQDAPDAGMGIVVDGAASSPMRVGTPETKDADGDTVEADPVEFTPWEHPSVGDEIEDLAGDEPGFDLVESHAWANPDPASGDTRIVHRLTIGYPRAGRRRDDLVFDTAVNITVDEPEITDGAAYANLVVAEGAGQGRDALMETYPRRDGRPRVMVAEQAKKIRSKDRLRTFARARATYRATAVLIPSITVSDHSSARLGSWQPGDDIFVRVETDWGVAEGWHRIITDHWRPDQADVATLDLEPASSFVYGAP